MSPPTPQLIASLRTLLQGRVLIVGVGNRWRGDDGAGPRLIDARPPDAHGCWLDAGAAPENHLGQIARIRPDVVLIVDAVAFRGNPGECRLFDPNELDGTSISTHAGSLKMLCDYLTARTEACIKVLAIQPSRVDDVSELTASVADTVRELALHVSDLLFECEAP